MSIAKNTTLALGASILGSAPSILIADLKYWLYFLGVLLLGCFLILHGTGFLQRNVIRPLLKTLRNKKTIIGVISDLPWNDATHPWASADMCPEQWCSKISCEVNKNNLKVVVKQIKIKNPLVRFFLDRYNVILNPFGSAYPEVNIKELPVLKTTLDYILNGGLFVNVADIPFYWAYDTERSIRYDLVKRSYQYIPFTYQTEDSRLFSLKSLSMQSFGPFTETPFADEVRVSVINTETPANNGEPSPTNYALEVKDTSLGINKINSVAINRAVVLERKSEYNAALKKGRIESVVEELDNNNGQSISPICYVNFGEGKILSSLVFLGYEKQNNAAKEWVVNLLCKLILKEVKGKDKPRKTSI